MRIVVTFLCLFISAVSLNAETFQGRKLNLTDGRANSNKAAPLIVAMHGFLGTADSMKDKTNFDRLARKHGLVVVYPSGLKRKWNDGRSRRNRTKDVAYLSGLINSLVSNGTADPNRVYLAGHSNGGGMAMRVACEKPSMIAGISVVATKIPANYQCRRGKPVPAIFFHGTEDPVAPHGGRPKESRLGQTLSAANTLMNWASRNKCRDRGSPRVIDRRDDGTKAKVFRYSGCRAPLTYVLIEGHGHAWPGAGPRLQRVQGHATKEVDAAVLSWAFFNQL